jgi:Uri superfamily endonuclease
MAKGIYVLVVSVGKDINVNVGALGRVNFERGLYAYVVLLKTIWKSA